jgi:hypothetical protein
VESTVETFPASLKDPLGLHHAEHHVFRIYSVEYLSSLWMSFKGQSHYGSGHVFPFRYVYMYGPRSAFGYKNCVHSFWSLKAAAATQKSHWSLSE